MIGLQVLATHRHVLYARELHLRRVRRAEQHVLLFGNAMPRAQFAARIEDIVQAVVRAIVDVDIGMSAALYKGGARGAASFVVEDGFFVRVVRAVSGFLFQLQRAKIRIGAGMIMVRDSKSWNGGI